MIVTRPAEPSDADAAAALLRRSIIELCVTDHQHDAATLAAWLANKTPKVFLAWLANLNNYVVVAEENHHIIGVGMIGRNGDVALLYLLPGVQRRGVGRAIFQKLEQQARAWGLRRLTAESNTDSRAFYEAMGFTSTGDAVPGFGIGRGWPYVKALRHEPPGNP